MCQRLRGIPPVDRVTFSLVIKNWGQLLGASATRTQLLFFVLLATLALAVGWLAVPTPLAAKLIKFGGYYYMLGVFAAFVFYVWRVASPRREVWLAWLQRPGWTGLVLALATAFVIWADPFEHKILFDEYVLQGTAWHMHATKEVGTVIRAYDLNGTWSGFEAFLDKRPYFFAFLVSLIHDLTGFRLGNTLAFNAVLAPVFLGLVYWLARAFAGARGPALLAVGLLATLPLFGQQATGAGMELHNLTMIAFTMVLAVLYLRAPDANRLAALVLAAVLLAQSRYESVLFVLPVAFIVALGWWKVRCVLLPWPALAAPLLLVPYVWQSRVVSASPILWQLREGETSRFGLNYFPGSVQGAWKFFFNTTPQVANSWWLSVLGIAAFVWAAGCAWRRFRQSGVVTSPAAIVLAGFGVGIAGNLFVLMFYYWSRLDEVIASRFALPMYLLAALVTAGMAAAFDRKRPYATRCAAAGLGLWVLGWGMPAYARRLYTSQNLVMLELKWEKEVVDTREGPLLLVTNKSSIPFILWRISAMNPPVARVRAAQIAWHMQQGTFREVLVAQALRPTSKDGERGVDPDDLLPDSFHLETIAEKRFGGRWDRISRVVRIDVPKEVPPEKPAATPLVN